MKLNRNVIVRTYNDRAFPDNLKVGDRVVLVMSQYVGPSNCWARYGEWHYSIYAADDMPNGVPGNMDPSRCSYTGWRGTTNDWSVEACGLREVLGITDIKRVIKGSNPDRIREWGWRIVLGKDISESE